MKLNITTLALIALVSGVNSNFAHAEGKLFIYTWADSISEEMIQKFESETGVDAVLDVYQSNDNLLAKLQAGGTGYDIIMPSQNYISILIDQGLIQKINAQTISGFENIEDKWKSPEWDPGNQYTVPYNWGLTGFSVNVAKFGGDINSYSLMFDPPTELQGKIGMFSAPDEVIPMVQMYLGVPLCNESDEDMQKVLEVLEKQKQFVKVYADDGLTERMVSGDVILEQNWNGNSMRMRDTLETVKYAFPKEGLLTWMDNLAVPTTAANRDNAIKFIEFYLRPENAALQTNKQRANNAIPASAPFVDPSLASAPELNPPADAKFVFSKRCSERAIKLVDAVWTKLMK